MTGADSGWPLMGRTEEIDYVRNRLLRDGGGGVFLVGPPGIGKTLIARHVSDDLSTELDEVFLRGSAATAGTPYGAISMVLAQLDEETSANPLMLLTSLQHHFAAGGRATLMVLDNVEEFDNFSAMVIAHLVRLGAVRLIGICEDMQRVPVELFNLWKDDIIQRLDVEPLNLEKTTELLTGALRSPVSRSVALELWQASGGNPRYLQALTLADVDSGHVVLREGVWVLDGGAANRSGRPITDCATGHLGRIGAGELPVVEAVAVTGGVPLEMLLEVFPDQAVSNLQEHGVLRTEQGAVPMVQVADGALAGAVRARLVSAPGRAALLTLNGLRARESMPPAGRAALIRWCLDNGIEVEPAALLGAAGEANARYDPDAALVFLTAGFRDARDPAAALERARALGLSRRIDEAFAVLGPFVGDGAQPLDAEVEVGVLLAAAGLAMRSHERHSETESILARARRRVAGLPPAAARDLRDRVEDFTAEWEFHEGRCAWLVETLPAAIQQRLAAGRPAHRLQGLLTSALAATGRQHAAVEMGRALLARMVGAELDPLEIERAGTHVFTALLAAGYWKEALSMAAAERGSAASIYDGSASEFTEGLLHAFAGRTRDALARLIPAISQLRTTDRHGLLPLAEAASSYALAVNGDQDAARAHLDALDLGSERHPWQYRNSAEYFRLLAREALGEADAAVAGLGALAEANAAAGNKGQELLFLSAAVQLGQDDLVERLCAAASTSEGPLARTLELFGKGITAGDSALLLDAASAALATGEDALAANAAERAIEFLESGDVMIGVYADQILRRAGAPGRKPRNRTILSERERKIARLVARGASNKAIADAEHVSVRTVEGHVHQILTKLGLSSRRQLALIFT